MGFDPQTREASLLSVHPGIRAEDVVANTGFPLRVPDGVAETPAPSAEELRLLRQEIDPRRVYLR
jgi:glutaconate CoA-transferase subunit B